MTITVDLQIASGSSHIPAFDDIENWVRTALMDKRDDAELTVRIVDEIESAELNQRWRKTSGPTNVLSFPADEVGTIIPELMGDIVVCAPVVEKEAAEQSKGLIAHWAHMIVHGTLHLAGFDHVDDIDAGEMETLEIRILKQLGISNPYV